MYGRPCEKIMSIIGVICRGLAPSTVSLTSNRDHGDDNKHDGDYSRSTMYWSIKYYEPPHDKTNTMTGQMRRLICAFAGRTCHFVGFIMRRLLYPNAAI